MPSARLVAIEGTVLSVCASCQRFGVGVSTPERRVGGSDPVIAERLSVRAKRMGTKDVLKDLETDEDFAADLGDRVRHARESRGWKQAELAAKINERASVIAKLESGGLMPDDVLLRKLERVLEVRLKEKLGKVSVKKYAGPSSATLGDLVGLDPR